MDTKKIEKQARFNYQILEMPLRDSCERAINENLTPKDISDLATMFDITVFDLVDDLEAKIKKELKL